MSDQNFKRNTLRSAGVLGVASAMLGAGAAQALEPGALPQDPTVTGGGATFAQSGRTLTVDQSTQRVVIDWRSFDVGAGAEVRFNQPNAAAIAVNRVNGSTDPTRIDGALRANGQVWILNPNGVLFGKTATVDVAGLLASTASIDPARFMAGDTRLQFTGADHGQVANEGSISIADNGLAAFVAPWVRNSGVIAAKVGKVALAAGTTFTLDLAGDRLVELGLGSGQAVVDQSGRIVADGGVIALSARSAGQVVDSVINMSGVLDASSIASVGGQIVLSADRVTTAPTAVLDADGAAGGGRIVAVADKSGDYAGRFSARGGALGGDGGFVETSGKTLKIADGVSVDTRAANGATGSWTLDPDNLVIDSSASGTIGSEDATIGAQTVVTALNTTDVVLKANASITVNAAIDASGNAAAHNLALNDQDGGGLTVNLNAGIALKSGGVLSGQATTVNLTSGALIQNGVDVARAGGATVKLLGGVYAPGATIDKSNLSLVGSAGATINVDPGSGQLNGINIGGSTTGVSVQGLTIQGEIDQSYLTYAFGAGVSRGIAVANGASGFTIAGNTIRNVRNGILVDGRNTGSITGNLIDNTKSALSVQYTDGAGIAIYGNSQGTFGNEWGQIVHLNGQYDGATIVSNPTSGTVLPTLAVQQALLAKAAANNGWSVQDLAYTGSNRTSVTVAATGGLAANQGSLRAPLSTIQQGIDAVVAGGTVNLLNGTYAVTGGYINVNKSLNLIGQSQAGVIIDARGASTYGLRVTAVDGPVALGNFTLYGVTAAGGYGLKAETTHGLTISNVTSRGAYKSEFDLNGVVGATLDHLTADGAAVADGSVTGGNGISFTDSQDVTLANSTTRDNAWGGLALYQSNSGTGYPLQTKNITVAASNSFGEANPVYAEDQSTTNDFGTLNIAGFDYLVKSPTDPADVYTWFQKTKQGAIDLAAAKGAGSYVEGYGSGVTGDNSFYVGASAGGQLLSIQTALDAALAGATVNVGAGTYAETLDISKSVNLLGAGLGQTVLKPGSLLATGVAHKYDANVKAVVFAHDAGGINLSGLTIDGDNLGANAIVFWNNASGSISNAAIQNVQAFSGNQSGQGLAVDASTGHAVDLAVNNVRFENWNKNAIDLVTSGGDATLTVTGSTFVGQGPTGLNAQNGILLWERAGGTVNATVDGSSFSNLAYTGASEAAAILRYGATNGALTVKNSSFSNVQTYIALDGGSAREVDATQGNVFDGVNQDGASLDQLFAIENRLLDGTDAAGAGLVRLKRGQVYVTAQKGDIQAGVAAAAAGDTVNVQGGAYAQAVAVDKRLNFNFGAVDLAGGFTLTGGAAGSGLSGFLRANAIALDAPTVLLGDLTLDTGAAGGALSLAAVDGAGAGGQALRLNSGAGALRIGSLGSAVRLGAVQASGPTLLTGSTYRAAGLSFGGDVTLTAGLTTLDTAAAGGTIAVAGALLGSSDGAQSVAFDSGAGDISLQNVGATGLALRDMTVNGDDFSAQTVRLAGDYTARLTGDQVFSAHTLNAGGQVTSTVGGNASGPINAGQSVNVAVEGSLTGAIQGSDVALTAGTLDGATVNASQSASVTAATVINSSVAASQNLVVNASTVNGSSLTANQAVTLSAATVSGVTLAAPTVTASAASFNGNVNSANAAISGGDISGSFSGGAFKLTGTGSVNATVNANSVQVQAPKGAVTGSWDSLQTGGAGAGGGLLVNNQAQGVNPVQLVVQNFTLPAGTRVTAGGQLVLPQGQVIGLLSPAGAGGAPKLIQVQTVGELGSLLAAGYTAIVIDLGPSGPAANDEGVRVSRR